MAIELNVVQFGQKRYKIIGLQSGSLINLPLTSGFNLYNKLGQSNSHNFEL
jgi:hypothetical protein